MGIPKIGNIGGISSFFHGFSQLEKERKEKGRTYFPDSPLKHFFNSAQLSFLSFSLSIPLVFGYFIPFSFFLPYVLSSILLSIAMYVLFFTLYGLFPLLCTSVLYLLIFFLLPSFYSHFLCIFFLCFCPSFLLSLVNFFSSDYWCKTINVHLTWDMRFMAAEITFSLLHYDYFYFWFFSI